MTRDELRKLLSKAYPDAPSMRQAILSYCEDYNRGYSTVFDWMGDKHEPPPELPDALRWRALQNSKDNG